MLKQIEMNLLLNKVTDQDKSFIVYYNGEWKDGQKSGYGE